MSIGQDQVEMGVDTLVVVAASGRIISNQHDAAGEEFITEQAEIGAMVVDDAALPEQMRDLPHSKPGLGQRDRVKHEPPLGGERGKRGLHTGGLEPARGHISD